MISLSIWIPMLLLLLLLEAWALAVSARLAGSPRGRLSVGLLVVLLTLAVNIAIGGVGLLLPVTDGTAGMVVGLIVLAVKLGAIFLVLRRTFDLSLRRAFIPFGTYIVLILVSLGLALGVVRPFLTEAFVFPTHSMKPTIEPGDRFLVNKIIRPRRWDLVAYRTSAQGYPTIYCHRLVALPGERLRFDQGTIYINDQPVTTPAVIAGRCHASLPGLSARVTRYQDGETIVLAGNEYFFIGDNIDIAGDSRARGPSDSSALVGVVDLIYWPPRKARVVR